MTADVFKLATLFFGLGVQYDDGIDPSVAINGSGIVVEVHKSPTFAKLYYHLGGVEGTTIRWGESHEYDSGVTPAVAMNGAGTVVEVHQTESPFSSDLYCRVGKVSIPLALKWEGSHKIQAGSRPAIAVNNLGVVVLVFQEHSNQNRMIYRVGKVNGAVIDWGPDRVYDTGIRPSVALNNSGHVVEVHQSEANKTLYYHVGTVAGDRIDWKPSQKYQPGVDPAVALKDDGVLYEVHQSDSKSTLWQIKGRIVTGGLIEWAGPAVEYDDGVNPACSANATWGLQVHQSDDRGVLYYSNALDMNRADWMGDRIADLRNRSLKKLVLPATHDSGMYAGNILGRCQDQSVYDQLRGGVRFFDLRPGKNLNILHGTVDGPPVQQVLDEVKKFMDEKHRELVILKFSHYGGDYQGKPGGFFDFTDKEYTALVTKIQTTLGDHLLAKTWSGRLADASLGSLIPSAGKVLVVCDGDFPIKVHRDNIFVYRDASSATAEKGDLTVFDDYANTNLNNKMESDQLAKFASFNGKCSKQPNVPCDLFLLSWTVTPITDVSAVSNTANRYLGWGGTQVGGPGNPFQRIANLLYVDYYERSRVTDVAIINNSYPQ